MKKKKPFIDIRIGKKILYRNAIYVVDGYRHATNLKTGWGRWFDDDQLVIPVKVKVKITVI